MKLTVDNQVLRLLCSGPKKGLATPLAESSSALTLGWPSLLEYLGLGRLLSRLPAFDAQPLFNATISALCEVDNPEDLFYIYDSLFTERLKQVKSLPEIDAGFLLQKIGEKKEEFQFPEGEKILSPALTEMEKALRENAPSALHDLILYLAWDRMCLCMATLFDAPCQDPKFLQNLRHLNWCLIESFHHIFGQIAGQEKTPPSFYRLTEALFYYQMREEHLSLHTESEWELLSQSFTVLKDPNELIDCYYIDSALADPSTPPQNPSCHWTLDPPALVERRLALARYILGRIKEVFPKWDYSLYPSEIVHF